MSRSARHDVLTPVPKSSSVTRRMRRDANMGHQPLLILRASVATSLVATQFACGARTPGGELSFDAGPPAFSPPPADAVAYDPSFGPLLDVPDGIAVVGLFQLDIAGRRIVPKACASPTGASGWAGSSRRYVRPFRLMKLEVTNAAYAECVKAGSCTPPDGLSADVDGGVFPVAGGHWDALEQQAKPVALSSDLAREFCRHYGGDLPTLGQYALAGTGGSPSFGVTAVTDTFVRCALGESLSDCTAVRSSNYAQDPTSFPETSVPPGTTRPGYYYLPLPNVGSSSWDVGPYGHLDLFASAVEWIRIPTHNPNTDPCAVGNDADWYLRDTPEYPPPQALLWRPSDALTEKLGIGMTIYPSALFEVVEPYVFIRGPLNYANGFRCAFPAAH